MLQIVLAVLVVNKIISKKIASYIFNHLKNKNIPENLNEAIRMLKEAEQQ